MITNKKIILDYFERKDNLNNEPCRIIMDERFIVPSKYVFMNRINPQIHLPKSSLTEQYDFIIYNDRCYFELPGYSLMLIINHEDDLEKNTRTYTASCVDDHYYYDITILNWTPSHSLVTIPVMDINLSALNKKSYRYNIKINHKFEADDKTIKSTDFGYFKIQPDKWNMSTSVYAPTQSSTLIQLNKNKQIQLGYYHEQYYIKINDVKYYILSYIKKSEDTIIYSVYAPQYKYLSEFIKLTFI
jgi:hypothetical protein